MTGEEFAFKDLDSFNKYVDGLLEEQIVNVEKEQESNKDTKPLSTKEDYVDKEFKKEEFKPLNSDLKTHDENGNPIIIGHCRKYLVKITNPDGVETLYGSSVVAEEYLGVTAATIRTRCRKGDFVDEYGNVWEEVSLADYKLENGINE